MSKLTKILLACASLVGSAGLYHRFIADAREPSYIGAFNDFDLYVLAIGADLRAAAALAGRRADPDLEEAAATALAMHRVGVVPIDSGWVFQPGAWRDYPDHRFAGVMEVAPEGPPPPPVSDVAPDVSHFSRWPLFLRSHAAGWGRGGREAEYYDGLRERLGWQFVRHVLVPPDAEFAGWRTRNYMDGRNGVYRWDYRSHRGRGYLPYQLSGTLLHGWWGFLGDTTVRDAYRDMASRFPYGAGEQRTYAGPWDSQPRLWDGRFELQTLLAASLEGGARADEARVGRLWATYGPASLGRALWRGPQAELVQYDLMVPLHYAFEANASRLQADFAGHFQAFVTAPWPREEGSILPRLHYMYFASRYLVLARGSARDAAALTLLEAKLLDEWRSLWTGYGTVISSTGWGEPAFTAYEPYLDWKLDRWSGPRR